MTNFEILQNAIENLNRINNAPLKNRGIEKLKKDVALIGKAVIEIIKTLPREQQQQIKEAVNNDEKEIPEAK